MKVSWDYDIPSIWKVIKFMFQTTNQINKPRRYPQQQKRERVIAEKQQKQPIELHLRVRRQWDFNISPVCYRNILHYPTLSP